MLKINNDEIKLIICDFDGTLHGWKQLESPELTVTEIQKAIKDKVYFMFNTGNLPYEMKNQVQIIGGETNEYNKYFIGCNGNAIKNFENEDIQVSTLFSKAEVLKIVEICERHAFHHYDITTADMEYIYYKDKEYMEWMISHKFHPEDNKHRLALTDEILQTIESSPKITLKMINQETKEKILQDIEQELPNTDIEYTWFMADGVDLQIKGISKFTGIVEVLKQINKENGTGYSLNNVIYFGDHHNDLSAFQNLKYTIAMGNAIDEIKETAYDITTNAEDGGVGAYLQKITV